MSRAKKSESKDENTNAVQEAEKIDAVRTYQPISFDKKNETFFSTRNSAKKQVEVKFHHFLEAVQITSKTDSVIVPLTNISAIYLKSPIKQEAIKAADEEQQKLKEMANWKQDKASRPI